MNRSPMNTITPNDLQSMMVRYHYSEETKRIIATENLLPIGVLNRLQAAYPQHSALKEDRPFIFPKGKNYSGLEGFRAACEILRENGIDIGNADERELFIKVYRFMATSHTLNSINWDNYENDPIYQLVIPQPGMITEETAKAYLEATTEEQRAWIIDGYAPSTNPHDGKQQLNKPWFKNSEGQVEILEGSQHKYPQCQLVFDKTTQSCFSFCTYCFRHAQVRGDEDMFIQEDVQQIHRYLKRHPEVTDLLLTGGDAGLMPLPRLKQYVMPIIESPDLMHIKALRLGSRALTYLPEMVLSHQYDSFLELFDLLHDHGIQVAWMAHFSTPRELLNPSVIAAIRRLQTHGVVIRSQSPMMNHISLFTDEQGKVDIEKSARNWINLAEILGMLNVGFHSMYCARPTGEHHYFTAPLADMEKIFNRIYRSLASIYRPSRHISMTISAGKLSIRGTCLVNGEKCFALQFTEARNMEWMDRVILAKYDEKETKVDLLRPLEGEAFFFEEELREIEAELSAALHIHLAESPEND